MIFDIFNACSLQETPKFKSFYNEDDLISRAPCAIGSRSGADGEYGLVELQVSAGFWGKFKRERVYIALNKDNVPRLRQLGLNF